MVKKIFTILLLGLVAFQAKGQVLDTIFNGYLSPLIDTAGSAPTWHFKAQFVNEGKTFTGATVTNASKILVAQGGRCYELDIDSVGYINGLIRGTVTDPSGSLTNLNVGGNIRFGAIVTPTPTRQLYPYVSGLPEVLQSCIESRNKIIIDTISAAGFAELVVTDTTISTTSYSVALSGSEERVLTDIAEIGNNTTITLPDPTSNLGKRVSIKQINPTGSFATTVMVNAIGNRLRLPGQTVLTNNLIIPAGTENEYIFTPAYDENSAVYIWSVIEPNLVYSTTSGMKFYDQVTSSEQSVKVDYEVDNVAAISSLKAPNGARITTSGYSSFGDGGSGVYLVESDSLAGYVTDGIAVIQLASGNYAKLQYDGQYKIGQFNVFPANDSTTNRVNLQRAMNYIGVTGKQNLLCNQSDTIKINCNTSLTFQFSKKSINFIGLDSARTIFRIYPDNPTSTFYAWNFSQTAQEVYYGVASFSDMKIIMPPKSSNAISSFWTLQLGGGELHTLRLRVEGEGNFVVYTTGANSASAKRVVSLKSSYFYADEDTESNTIGMFGGRDENYLLADNCIFAGAGPNAHQWYVMPWLNISAKDCQFGEDYQGGSAQCIQANQTVTGTWPTWVNTKYQIFDNCTFVSGNYSALNTDRDYFPFLVVKNCNFFNTGDKLTVKQNAVLEGNNFYNTGPSTLNVDAGTSSFTITGGKFIGGGKMRVIGGTAAKKVYVNVANAYMKDVQGAFETRLTYAADTVRANWNISNCMLINTGGSSSCPIYYSENGVYTATQIFDNCYFEGHSMFRGNNSSNYQIMINGGEWRSNGGRFYTNLSETGQTPGFGIEIRNLKIHNYTHSVVEDRNDDTTAARIKWFFPEFEWPRDINIQSDNTVDSINIGHGVYRITDTGNRDSVVTLGLYTEQEPVVPMSNFTYDFTWKKYVAGSLRLIAKDEFVLGNSGNINLPAPYIVRQGRRVELEFDRNDMKWRCLNCIDPTPIESEVTTAATLTRFFTITSVDVSAGAAEIDLPTGTPNSGDWFIVTDSRGNAGTFNITVDFINAGDNLHGSSQNYILNVDNDTAKFTYINSTIGWIREH